MSEKKWQSEWWLLTVANIVQEEPGEALDKEDDDGAPHDIERSGRSHVAEEELETTEGEEVDVLAAHLELEGSQLKYNRSV